MDIESLADRIIELVYHTAALHEDPYTQERMTRWELIYLLSDFADQVYELSDEVSA